MTPEKAYKLGIRAPECRALSMTGRYSNDWVVVSFGRVLTQGNAYYVTQWIGTLGRLDT